MAINIIPGVGPQNTDIASAVVTAGTSAGFAATGPTTTQIAAAVPTLTQITSAITTNAASAGVTNASIASAITTNAASAGVTNASIAATVAANAGSPFGGTYTQIANSTPSNVDTTTISGLGSYKYLKIQFYIYNSSSSSFTLNIRFNGDSGSNYFTTNNYLISAGSTAVINTTMNATAALLFPAPSNASAEQTGTLDIRDNNATNSFKDARIWGGTTTYGGARTTLNGQVVYISSSVISSVTFLTSNSTSGNIRIWGAN